MWLSTSNDGAAARAVRGWLHGECELVVSRLLLEELGRALQQHLLELAEDLPIYSPVGFLDLLALGGVSER